MRGLGRWRAVLVVVLTIGVATVSPAAAQDSCPQSAVTTTPAPPKSPRVARRMQDIVTGITGQKLDVVLVGDSLVAGWGRYDYWSKAAPPLKVYNLGVGGDRTQNVLLRMSDEHYAQLEPRWALILVGSNNLTDRDPPCAVVAGITSVAKRAGQLWPNVKILVLKILPRGKDWHRLQAVREQTNELLDEAAQKNGWKLLDVGSEVSCGFTQPCANYGPDLLHVSVEGYAILTQRAADAMR